MTGEIASPNDNIREKIVMGNHNEAAERMVL
jgi:hypothetical protein